MAASSGRYGKPEKFLTRSEHLEFRGITKMLEMTDGIEGTLEERGTILKPGNLDESDEFLHRKLASFNQLLVREHEVVALVAKNSANSSVISISGSPITGQDDRDETVEISSSEGALVTRNPRRDTIPSDQGSGVPGLDAAFVTPTLADLGTKTISQFFLESLRSYENQPEKFGRAKSSLCYPFSMEKHGHVVAFLLKVAYEDHDEDVTREYWADFVIYVMLASNGKMISRFKIADKTNIGDVFKLEGLAADFAAKHHDVFPSTLSNQLPSAQQQKFLERSILFWIAKEEMTPEVAMSFGWDHEGRTYTPQPLYDREGRKRFQTLLKVAYTCARKCVDALKQHLYDNTPKKPSKIFPPESLEGEVEKVSVAAEESWQALYAWHTLQKNFDKILDSHLEWLQQIFSLKRAIPRGQFRYIRKPRPGSDLPSSSPRASSQTQHSSQLEAPTIQKSDPPSSPLNYHQGEAALHITKTQENTTAKELAEGLEGMEIEEYDDELDEHIEEEYLEALPRGWVLKARRYMHITVQYIDAILQLKPPRPKSAASGHDIQLRSYINNLKLMTLKVDPDHRDMDTMSADDVLDNFQVGGQPIDQESRDLIRQWIMDMFTAKEGLNMSKEVVTRTMADKKGFKGTWHCETIHVVLHLLALRDPIDYVDSSDVSQHDDESLRLPDESVIEHFKKMQNLVAVSKRCCPACNILVNHMGIMGKNKLVYSGSHVVWSAVALPPWLLREDGEIVVQSAKDKLSERLSKIISSQREKNQFRRSLSTGSTTFPDKRPREDTGEDEDDSFVSATRGQSKRRRLENVSEEENEA